MHLGCQRIYTRFPEAPGPHCHTELSHRVSFLVMILFDCKVLVILLCILRNPRGGLSIPVGPGAHPICFPGLDKPECSSRVHAKPLGGDIIQSEKKRYACVAYTQDWRGYESSEFKK